ncbi:MAG TPA: hypothetical protein VFO16_01675 [Pseudonocardiaceae bacterium]|nr:hypothetical protein [Pseudonocardiaceae bacterium]
MNTMVDLLTALGAHLAEFELPAIASVHLATYTSGPQVTVQLHCHGSAVIARGLLAWADTLTEIITEAWRVPHGEFLHLSVTGLLPGGTAVRVCGALRITDIALSRDIGPTATITVPLAILRHLATPGQVADEVTLS